MEAEDPKLLEECAKESCDMLRILNDDCLQHVIEYLNFKHINALRKCCHRLNRIGDAEINYRFRIKPVSVVSHGWQTVYKHADVVRHLIVNRKLSTTKLIINLKVLLWRCTSLEKLELCKVSKSKFFSMIALSDTFSKLKVLEMHFKYNDHKRPGKAITSTMEHCQHLEILRLSGQIPNEIFNIHYPSLHEMSVIVQYRYVTISDKIITKFYAKNLHISKLIFVDMTRTIPVMDVSGLEVMKN